MTLGGRNRLARLDFNADFPCIDMTRQAVAWRHGQTVELVLFLDIQPEDDVLTTEVSELEVDNPIELKPDNSMSVSLEILPSVPIDGLVGEQPGVNLDPGCSSPIEMQFENLRIVEGGPFAKP